MRSLARQTADVCMHACHTFFVLHVQITAVINRLIEEKFQVPHVSCAGRTRAGARARACVLARAGHIERAIPNALVRGATCFGLLRKTRTG